MDRRALIIGLTSLTALLAGVFLARARMGEDTPGTPKDAPDAIFTHLGAGEGGETGGARRVYLRFEGEALEWSLLVRQGEQTVEWGNEALSRVVPESTAALAGGQAIFILDAAAVGAFSLSDGSLVWERPQDDWHPSASERFELLPLAGEQLLTLAQHGPEAASPRGRLELLDVRTGAARAELKVPGFQALRVSEDWLMVHTDTDTDTDGGPQLWAVDPSAGVVRRSVPHAGGEWCVDEGVLYSFEDGAVRAVTLASEEIERGPSVLDRGLGEAGEPVACAVRGELLVWAFAGLDERAQLLATDKSGGLRWRLALGGPHALRRWSDRPGVEAPGAVVLAGAVPRHVPLVLDGASAEGPRQLLILDLDAGKILSRRTTRRSFEGGPSELGFTFLGDMAYWTPQADQEIPGTLVAFDPSAPEALRAVTWEFIELSPGARSGDRLSLGVPMGFGLEFQDRTLDAKTLAVLSETNEGEDGVPVQTLAPDSDFFRPSPD